MTPIEFAGSRFFTLGVELEFQLIDRESFNLVPVAPTIIDHVPDALQSRVVQEFLQSIVEIRTGVCDTVDDAKEDLQATILAVQKVAEAHNCLLSSSSLHPFACPEDQVLSFGERYARIMKELQYVGRQFICQGLHVHVGMPDGETAIKVCDTIQAYLPLLLAPSCSSPFFRGEDTGFSSYRTKLFEALPLAGLTGFHQTWKGFEREVQMLRDNHVIADFRDLWWDVRPSPFLGTVEIRIFDLPLRFAHVLGLVALAQGLVAGLTRNMAEHQPISHQVLSRNKWQAARHGLGGIFVDPLGLLGHGSMPMVDALSRLITVVQPMLVSFGSQAYVAAIGELCQTMNGADKQRQLIAEGRNFPEMLQQLHNEYWS
ncbi:carboxylate-amine ligase [Desulfogranum marinum]|uniref:carboxylate-amine ligase n=1 Tax=Desulfogranum marinum TaxID=453220 RepID=UPI0019669347|nr:YbdK family carboxylate-amine ligase [Desulfogranum marinum]MBM9513138.1 YbdK family carboxylate-amine ligase [Desulfogranum marinum]